MASASTSLRVSPLTSKSLVQVLHPQQAFQGIAERLLLRFKVFSCLFKASQGELSGPAVSEAGPLLAR